MYRKIITQSKTLALIHYVCVCAHCASPTLCWLKSNLYFTIWGSNYEIVVR